MKKNNFFFFIKRISIVKEIFYLCVYTTHSFFSRYGEILLFDDVKRLYNVCIHRKGNAKSKQNIISK